MFTLLELIFQGFSEWVYSLVLECWNYFSSSLLDIMSLDFEYIKTNVPVVEDITQVFLAAGWALLLGNLVFQALRSMVSGLGFEGEDPKLLFARTFVFSFLLLASPQICEIGLNLTSQVMALLEIPDAIDVHLVDDSLFGTLTAAWLLVIIFDIIIMFKVLKLLLEVAERYVILAVLAITAPLAFSMGGSKSTAEIFTGWCRMFGSMCLLMGTNVMFFKMLLSVVSSVPSGLDVFPWMVLIITIVKVAKKADEIITRIGLNPAITGDKGRGFGGVLSYIVFRSAASKVAKTIGAAVTGGASTAAGAVAGGVKCAAGAAGAAGMAGGAGAAGAAGAAARTGGQKGQRSGSPQEKLGDPAPQGGTQAAPGGPSGQNPGRDGPSRKSSVSPGTRRAASHIPGGGTENPVPESGRTAGSFSGGRSGGSFSGGSSGHSGTKQFGRSGSGRLRPVTVYADDFDDGYTENSSPHGTPPAGGVNMTPTGASPGGAGSSRPAGPAGTAPAAEYSGGGRQSFQRGETTVKGSSTQDHQRTDTRSTRREDTSSRQCSGQAASPQTPRSSPTAGGPSSARQEQRSAAETASARSGGTGKRKDTVPRSKRRRSAPVRQESSGQTPLADSPAHGGGSIASPGPAGAGHVSDSERPRFRERSPSPARQEPLGGAKGIVQKSGTPAIRPAPAGIDRGSSTQTPAPKQRSITPVRQETGKASTPVEAAVKGGGPVGRPGPAGIDGGSSTQMPVPKQRSTTPVRQEAGKAPAPAEPPAKGSGPVPRLDGRPPAGPTGTAQNRHSRRDGQRRPPEDKK